MVSSDFIAILCEGFVEVENSWGVHLVVRYKSKKN